MRRLVVTLLVLGLLGAVNLVASDWNSPSPYFNLDGLLNPNNMRMNHTMSFMTGVSSSGKGFYQSTYTNHLFFDLHPKVDLNVDLNFVNYGSTIWNDSFSVKANNDNATAVLPEFSLNYRPSDNMHFRIEFRSLYSPYQSSRTRWYD